MSAADDLKNGLHTRAEIENLCRFHASELNFPDAINRWAFLVALSGCETSFGRNNIPRFELGYSKSSLAYKRSILLQEGYELYGDLCAQSYGPHQILWIVARELGYSLQSSPLNLTSGVISIPYVIAHLNRFGGFGAKTIEDYAASYNAGPGILKNGKEYPKAYVKKLIGFYQDLVQTDPK